MKRRENESREKLKDVSDTVKREFDACSEARNQELILLVTDYVRKQTQVEQNLLKLWTGLEQSLPEVPEDI